MIKQVSNKVSQDLIRGQSGSTPRDDTGNRRPRDKLDRSSRRAGPPATPVVILVEHRDDVFGRLEHCLTAAGFRVTRARSSTEAVKRYVSQPPDLLVVNADRPEETAWLLAAKLHLTHPAARIWVYMRRPSAFDVAAANLLAIEELIAYDGKIAGLQTQMMDRLGASAAVPAPCSGGSIRLDPVEVAV